MESLTTVPLLIIDDFGMRKLPMTAAEDLLEIVMRRYERASTLLTSNRPVEDWGKLLGQCHARPSAPSRSRAQVWPAELAHEGGGRWLMIVTRLERLAVSKKRSSGRYWAGSRTS
jgi:hypothetical protein